MGGPMQSSNRGGSQSGRERSQVVAADAVSRVCVPTQATDRLGVAHRASCPPPAPDRRAFVGSQLSVTDAFVVAPIRVHRECLSAALNKTRTLSVVGAAETVAEALPQIRDLCPEVVVLDAPMPEDLELTIAETGEPGVSLVAVGVRTDAAVEWIEAGVSGCVPTEASLDDLIVAVESVARGQAVTSPEVTAHLITRVRALAAVAPQGAEERLLTPRQVEVLDLVAEGLSNKQVARRLSIQEQTVKNHMQRILRVLGVHRRGEAAAWLRRRDRRPRQARR